MKCWPFISAPVRTNWTLLVMFGSQPLISQYVICFSIKFHDHSWVKNDPQVLTHWICTTLYPPLRISEFTWWASSLSYQLIVLLCKSDRRWKCLSWEQDLPFWYRPSSSAVRMLSCQVTGWLELQQNFDIYSAMARKCMPQFPSGIFRLMNI